MYHSIKCLAKKCSSFPFTRTEETLPKGAIQPTKRSKLPAPVSDDQLLNLLQPDKLQVLEAPIHGDYSSHLKVHYKVLKPSICQGSYPHMALVVFWFDFICFGIVVVAFCGSLWILRRKGLATKCDGNVIIYESLLVARPHHTGDEYVNALPANHVGSSQLWTSCWKGMHPGWLLATRFGSFLAMAGFLSWDIVDWDAAVFVNYTEWTFALVMVYFAVGTVVSAYGCWLTSMKPVSEDGATDEFPSRDVKDAETTNSLIYREKRIRGTIKLQSHYAEEAIQQRAGFWGYLMQTIYQTSAGAVILTDIVFWCILIPFESNARHGLDVLMGCMHTLNAVFLLVDTALNSLPFPWFRLAYFVQWSCTYVVFQWVLHACGFSWWPYPFLELNTPWAPLWYLALAVFHIPCYGIYALIVEAKNSIFPRWFPRAFVRSY